MEIIAAEHPEMIRTNIWHACEAIDRIKKSKISGQRFCFEVFPAVRAGFEPAVQFNPYGSLANY